MFTHNRIHPTRFSPSPGLVAVGLIGALALAAFTGTVGAHAADPGDDDFLGTAEDVAIIASDTITDTIPHTTTVDGDVDLTGTANGISASQVAVGSTINTNNAVATVARNDLNTAYVIVANTGATDTLVPTVDLAARVGPYLPGVYFSPSDLLLAGAIVLDGGADDVFIFQASTGSLTVQAGSVVTLTGGAQACNVYWQVGSSATIGTNAQFVGTVLAATSIAMQNGATIDGQLLASALNAGEVTLDNNVINSGTTCVRASSTGVVGGTGGTTGGATGPGSTPGTRGSGGGGTTGGTTTVTTSGSTSSRFATSSAVRNSTLANTGTESTTALLVALAGILAGGVLLVIARRRQPE